MAYPSSGTQSQTRFPISKFSSSIPVKPTIPGNSFKPFLSKSLFFALCFAFLPLLPSQVPDCMDNVIPAKLWEILYFVFIGIAVSYGLFSKRNAQKELETLPPVEHTQSYASSLIHSSPFFEDAFEISHGSDEKIRIYSSKLRNDLEISSMKVLVDRRNKIDYEPMGLPIRSLKSGIFNTERSDFSCVSDSSSASNCSSSDSMKCGRMEFGNLDPKNLKDTFDEASLSSSPSVPRKSRSGRTETREKVNNVANPVHFWPLSDDEAQNESLKSRSFRSTKSNSFNSSSELSNFGCENRVEKREVSGSSCSTSTSPLTQIIGTNLHGVGSLKDLNLKRGENLPFSKESRLRSSKIPARGMSVRTIRPNRVVSEAMDAGETCRNHANKNGKEKADLINNGSQNLDNANSSETERDNHEVDKKADEFIAKFREQIKLQKTASLMRSTKNNI